jgi:glutaredoxin
VVAIGSTDPAAATGAAARVVLFTRPGCHLCDVARELVARVTADVGELFVERDITAEPAEGDARALDPAQLRDYLESIPVVVVDGVQVGFWHISEDRLRAALAR